MITRETTFEEMRNKRYISMATLNGADRMGWKNLSEMMHATGTLSALLNVPFKNKRVYEELSIMLDSLTEMDQSIAVYLEIEWESIERFEHLLERLAEEDAAGSEIRQCFNGAWELRTIAIYYPLALEERLDDYPLIRRKDMIEWVIAFFRKVEDEALVLKGSNLHLSGLDVAIDELNKTRMRYYFIRQDEPFPEWSRFWRYEFECLEWDLRIPSLSSATKKDPSLRDRIVSVAHLSKERFVEDVGQLLNQRTAERIYERLLPDLIEAMDKWEKTSEAERMCHIAEFIIESPILGEDRETLLDSIGRIGSLPMFFLAVIMLEDSDCNRDFVFAAANGIIEDLDDRINDGLERGLYSKESVRSWSKGNISPSTLERLSQMDWSRYTEFNEGFFLFEDDPIWKRINEEEHVAIKFEGFGALLSLTHGFCLEKVNGRSLLINQLKLPAFKVTDYAQELEKVIKGSYSDTVCVDLREIAGVGSSPLPLDRLSKLTSWLTGKECEDGRLVLTRNKVDVEQVFVRYLEEKGEPMPWQELVERFQKEYPEIKLAVNTLHNVLIGNPRFLARKAMGVYALCEWKESFDGSIGDLAVRVLRENGEPLAIEDLHARVVEVFKDTTIRSMEGCLRLDTRKRFVKLPGRRIGLVLSEKS